MPTETADEVIARDQCMSCSTGTSSTPGMLRAPAETISNVNTAATTTQA